jgi:hypothetical protein
MWLKTHVAQFFSFADSKGKSGGYFGFFPMCSHQVLNGFSIYFPSLHLNMFPIAPHFVPYALSKTQHQKFEKKNHW